MMIEREAPVGVFDSGIGGLTVAREIMRNLPSEKIVYFGDTARVPYGNKSRETVLRYSRQIIRFLQEQKVKAIVVACNTASAFALEEVKDELDIPIIGVIESGARVAAEVTVNKVIGVIGTEGTIGSGIHAFRRLRKGEAAGRNDHGQAKRPRQDSFHFRVFHYQTLPFFSYLFDRFEDIRSLSAQRAGEVIR